jgi:DNA-binding transcriptional ArsR family regulator
MTQVFASEHQLLLLRERGVVERRIAGRMVYDRLSDDHLRDLVLGAATDASEVA